MEETLQEIRDRYAPNDERPLGGFLAAVGTYSAVVASGALVARSRGVKLPERVAISDIALIAVATYKVSRLLSKDPVTSPFRAPFTRFAGTTGPAELKEEVRGTGVQKAVGELVTCPFCLGQWVGTGFMFGLVARPRATRAVAAVFAAVAGSDFLQHAYAHLQE